MEQYYIISAMKNKEEVFLNVDKFTESFYYSNFDGKKLIESTALKCIDDIKNDFKNQNGEYYLPNIDINSFKLKKVIVEETPINLNIEQTKDIKVCGGCTKRGMVAGSINI